MAEKLSLALIAQNEAHDLPVCLQSCEGLVCEIALVDNFSDDDTAKIAKSKNAIVKQQKFENFTDQKNTALSLCTNEWILHLDPDEKLSPELKQEIADLLESGKINDFDAYNISYTNYFLGKKMSHSGLNNEKHIRLFRKSKSLFEGGKVHEGIVVNGKTGVLKGKIIHNSYPDLDEYFDKFNRYTTLAAEKMMAQGIKFSLLRVAAVPFEFLKRYVIKLGFLDGYAGFVWACVSSFYVFVKYTKLWSLTRKND